MNYFFLDASRLAKRYSLEAGVDLMDQLFLKASRDRLFCLMLGAAEVVSVLVRRAAMAVYFPPTPSPMPY